MTLPLDATGRQRSPATMPGFHAGRSPRNRGRHYPADPPRVEEIIAVMRAAGDRLRGARARGLIVVLWRAGLRISEALDLREGDLDPARGALLVRRGKGGRRREVGMDEWGWEHLRPWLEHRVSCRSELCSASSAGPLEAGHGPIPRFGRSFASSRRRRRSGAGSPRTSSATPMRSRWPARVCR
jgi:integrase